MCGTETFRDDEIEALADRFLGGISKERFRPRIPDANHAVAVGEDDGIGRLFDDAPMQPGIRLFTVHRVLLLVQIIVLPL